jgi:hypothetical protein
MERSGSDGEGVVVVVVLLLLIDRYKNNFREETLLDGIKRKLWYEDCNEIHCLV